MKKLFNVILVCFLVYGFDSCNSSVIDEKSEEIDKKVVEVESCVARVSSITRSEEMFLHLKLKLKTNVDTLTYVKLRVSMVDKYDKKWFDQVVMIKDVDCNFNELCELDNYISFYENSHEYFSSRFGKSYNSFDLVLMNAKDFEYFRADSLYKGEVVNYNHNAGSGYDRILIPDAKFEVIDFK